MNYDDDDALYNTLVKSEPALKDLVTEEEIEYEYKFYDYVAGTKNNRLLILASSDEIGHTAKERQLIKSEAAESKAKLLIQVVLPNYCIVFAEDNVEKIGIVPVNNPDGFYC